MAVSTRSTASGPPLLVECSYSRAMTEIVTIGPPVVLALAIAAIAGVYLRRLISSGDSE